MNGNLPDGPELTCYQCGCRQFREHRGARVHSVLECLACHGEIGITVLHRTKDKPADVYFEIPKYLTKPDAR